jgi:hypothetical protein
MNISIRKLKWLLFSLFALIVIFYFIFWYAEINYIMISALSAFLGFQAIFLFVPEETGLFRPINPSILFVLAAISSLMMTLLIAALLFSAVKLFNLKGEYWYWWASLTIMGLNWSTWSTFFFIRYKGIEFIKSYRGLVSTMIISNLIALLFTIISHSIVSHRPSSGWMDLSSMVTSICMYVVIAVLLWTIFPGVLFLFIHKKAKQTSK